MELKDLNSWCGHEFFCIKSPPCCMVSVWCSCLLLFQLYFWYSPICFNTTHTLCMGKMSCLNKCSFFFFFFLVKSDICFSEATILYFTDVPKHTSFYFDTGEGHTQSRLCALVLYSPIFCFSGASLFGFEQSEKSHRLLLVLLLSLHVGFFMWGMTRLSKLVWSLNSN